VRQGAADPGAGRCAAIRFPGPLDDRAQQVMDGTRPPAVPRDAATVMLLRAAGTGSAGPARAGRPGGLEVYMLRRKSSMAFAPGAFVFPGGAVDARDADELIDWTGPDPAAWGQVFAASPELARALVCAAVRETFEESGVLLAGPSAGSVVADTTSDDWEADRAALLDRSLSLAELLRRRRLVLRADLLRPWSRWITPAVEPRRYDARFFAARLPSGQRTRDVGGEAAAVTWIAPGAALAAGRRRDIELWPPTAVSLAELAACGDVDTALTGPRQVVPRIPEVLIKEGAAWLTVPGVREYPL
jgi:8-oxo-dGTP pyrophosphatase MutT (NUDIX family)